jgi:hypothetical protein
MRITISLQGIRADTVARNNIGLDDIIFGNGLSGIMDIEDGPEGFQYILAVKKFQQDNQGTLYRIVPSGFHNSDN